MTSFLTLRWSPADHLADLRATLFGEQLRERRPDWKISIDQPGWLVAERKRTGEGSALNPNEGEFIIVGRIFDRAADATNGIAAVPIPVERYDFAGLCNHLVHSKWGGYVLLGRHPADPDSLDVFRDPVGMLDAFTWTSGRLRLVASHPEEWLDLYPADNVAIDWARIAELLAFPGSVADASPLHGVLAIAAGTHVHLAAAGARQVRRYWSPHDYCASKHVDTSPEALATLVTTCVASWLQNAGTVGGEISGGLDSAIVAASQPDAPALAAAFNFYPPDSSGDERRYARAISERLHIPLHEVLCDVHGFGFEDVVDTPIGVRPGLGSVSLFHDRELARRLHELGVDTLATGQGGDAVFFQPATPLVAADRSFAQLLFTPALLMSIARWTRTPIWLLLAQTLGSVAGHKPFRVPPNGMAALMPERPNVPRYDWLVGSEHLAPAKQLQIWALNNSRAAFGPSWCASVADVVHPLLSQPLIEHVLGLSTIQLTGGRRNRGLARTAFSERLPSAVIDRTGKGALTFHFGLRLARSTPFLRNFLLDGVLTAQGIIDRARLEGFLTPASLMQSDFYSELLTMILLEQWARVWQSRLAEMPSRSKDDRISREGAGSFRFPSNQRKTRS